MGPGLRLLTSRPIIPSSLKPSQAQRRPVQQKLANPIQNSAFSSLKRRRFGVVPSWLKRRRLVLFSPHLLSLAAGLSPFYLPNRRPASLISFLCQLPPKPDLPLLAFSCSWSALPCAGSFLSPYLTSLGLVSPLRR
ncbi:Uncharacterized protein TCM_034871 [Theobroma cacao]|uniref:Uncharacterized protein n=1 Tax=Theobroma cacao TaxID=3641 RepID=A0A061FN53_THECC|nr:Uncharacterized protein TCM_034871 [Theobroma cacao]